MKGLSIEKNMINKLVQAVREAQNIKQNDVAAEAEITQSAVAKFEAGLSTLSDETLVKLAPSINMNPKYFLGKSPNPFKCSNSSGLIKMHLREYFATPIDFSLIYFIAQASNKLEFLFLAPHISTMRNIAYPFDIPIYAILMKDNYGNEFLFRRKTKSVYFASITGTAKLTEKITEILGRENVSFSSVAIEEELYHKIKNWETVTKRDIAVLFKSNQNIFSLTDSEAEMLKKLRNENISPAEILKYIKNRSD